MTLHRPPTRLLSVRRASTAWRVVIVGVLAVFMGGCTRAAPDTGVTPQAKANFVVNGPADLPPGTQVRYHARGQWFGVRVGRVAEATADTLWLRERDMFWRKRRHPIPVARLRDLQFTRASYTKEDKVGVAMLAGGIVSWMLALSVPPPSGVETEGVEGMLEFYSILVGSLTSGIVFGLALPGDAYEPVPLPADQR